MYTSFVIRKHSLCTERINQPEVHTEEQIILAVPLANVLQYATGEAEWSREYS